MNKIKLVIIGFITSILLLFFYSYTQVDLGLTLSRFPSLEAIQRSFQYVGFFQRPISAGLYTVILLLLFIFYLFFLRFSEDKVIKLNIWKVIIFTAIVLTFSYNAFSYDIFNYIFDAKIVTFYHQNPYIHRALDYSGDPMLSFMHWIERTYPYGPVWLLVTIPLSLIGFQFFLPTFLLFKLLAAVSYICTAYFIGKIAKKINTGEHFSVILFALNPLIIIESLVSAHNDILMMSFAILSFWYILNNRNIRSFILLILSVGVKFATLFTLPVIIFVIISNFLKKKFSIMKMFYACSILSIVPVILASLRTNFQPWYLFYVIPFASVLGKKYFSVVPIFCMSFFALLEYVPFLYRGDWNSPVPLILLWLTSLGVCSSLVIVLIIHFSQLKSKVVK